VLDSGQLLIATSVLLLGGKISDPLKSYNCSPGTKAIILTPLHYNLK